MIKYFATFRYPNRVGTHGNSAFSMAHAWDYAIQVKNIKLQKAITQAAGEWFEADTQCPLHIEPSGGDFVSPCLAVANLMAKIKPQNDFLKWFNLYMPSIKEKNQNLFFPPITKDIKDPVAGHLVGLTFQRSWSMQSILTKLPEKHALSSILRSSQRLHSQAGMKQMFDTGYGGTHWLASFAIHALLK